MSRSVNMFVYLGSGEEGEKFEAMIRDEAVKRGFVKKDGQANMSTFVLYCVKYVILQVRPTKGVK